MDYALYDSSGTDDDLPPSHQNRPLRGGRVAGSERSAAINSMPYSNIYAETDMEAQIHQLEQEAYSSVLRAFKAQADAITWEKESLITELRKELRLSNEEHRELSTRVNSDDLIRRIREWRQSGGFQAIHDPVPSPTVSASRKNKKINKAMPSPPFPPQPVAALSQPSSLVAKRGPITGAKGKKQKPGQTLPPGPLMRTQQPADGASLNNLVGRRVRTRWPDDNSFYEAVITDYDPTERRHALVYDIGTANETWEWVDLAEISPDDIQWVGEDPGIYRQGGSGHVMGRGRGTTKGQFKKDFPASKNGNGMKGSDEIQILNTDTLIKEVERVFSGSDPDPLDVERAKKLLNDQEQALADAISLLAALSDNESDEVAIS